MDDATLTAIAAEVKKQDEAFDEAMRALAALGDITIEMPERFAEELDDICATNDTVPDAQFFGPPV